MTSHPKPLLDRPSPASRGRAHIANFWARTWYQHGRLLMLVCTFLFLFTMEAMAQEAKVRGFFTKARDLLIWMGPAVTIGSLFWGGANVLRERPAGKQWAAAAIFLALTILSGVLQDWWG